MKWIATLRFAALAIVHVNQLVTLLHHFLFTYFPHAKMFNISFFFLATFSLFTFGANKERKSGGKREKSRASLELYKFQCAALNKMSVLLLKFNNSMLIQGGTAAISSLRLEWHKVP